MCTHKHTHTHRHAHISTLTHSLTPFLLPSPEAMTPEELNEAEKLVLRIIDSNHRVYAKEIQGLRAVFDETYPDPVRVLSIGEPVETLVAEPSGPWATQYSVEFCGGT